jgi:integrase
VRAIIEAAEQPWRTLFAVAAMTGLRPGEVLGLSTDDLDFERRLIHVRRSAWYSKLQSPKNQSSVAAIPMPAALETALRDYLSVWRPNPQSLLFATRTGKPISRNFIVEHKLRPILDALGIARCGLHGFRHTHASLLVSLGASPVVAQRQLRHADPMTTLRNYTHVLGDEQRQAVERVAEILRPDVAKSQKTGEWIQ